ncbi:hypothetical protein [Phenylobacterium sp.]|uniref:hypothetical protein n=1 Tax=Phenylobacterium sp. TaxID=1871053 RepID=UPI0035AF4A00
MRLRLAAAVLVLACGSAAAEPPMSTAGAAAPLPVVTEPAPIARTPATPSQDREAREIGDWAEGVLAGRPSAPAPEEIAAAPEGRCPPSDGKPHGQVWGGIGTRGYREIGGVVSQRLGDCGSVTVGISHTEGDFGRRRR